MKTGTGKRLGKLGTFIKKHHYWFAGALLAIMLAMGVGSMRNDSAIVDEVAHISAGYSYMKFGDYRLNPEHPPLMKDLAALPLLPMRLLFPTDAQAWTKDVNGQWEVGWNFLYHYGNNADQILFASRLPILLLAVGFGALLYEISRRYLGIGGGLIVLGLYAFDPNILAHARFVTTDAGAAATMFLAVTAYLYWLRIPNWRRWGLATLAFSIAQVTKFSAILLIPFFGAMMVWALIVKLDKKSWRENLKRYLLPTIGLGVASLLLIWAFYALHVYNMPQPVQESLIRGSLVNPLQKPIVGVLVNMSHSVILRPLVEYILGVVMVFTRVSGGNTTYFLGETTNQSFKWYFPVTYLIKTPLPLLIATLASVIVGAWLVLRRGTKHLWKRLVTYSRNHSMETVSIGFIGFYAGISIAGNLNLGIRHLLPILPFVSFVVGSAAIRLYRRFPRRWLVYVGGVLAASYALLTILAYPHFVAYFNQLIGGGGNSYKYVSDSSVDWGQDLRRLKTYVQEHPEIHSIAVDYFGGGQTDYYFCNRKYDASGALIKNSSGYDCTGSIYVPWHAQYGIYDGQYMAVSETYLMNDLYASKVRGDRGYTDLRELKPIAKVGDSIYIYKVH